MSIGDYENATSRAWESIIRKIEDERDALQARLDAAEAKGARLEADLAFVLLRERAARAVVEAARVLVDEVLNRLPGQTSGPRCDALKEALAVFDGLARSGDA